MKINIQPFTKLAAWLDDTFYTQIFESTAWREISEKIYIKYQIDYGQA